MPRGQVSITTKDKPFITSNSCIGLGRLTHDWKSSCRISFDMLKLLYHESYALSSFIWRINRVYHIRPSQFENFQIIHFETMIPSHNKELVSFVIIMSHLWKGEFCQFRDGQSNVISLQPNQRIAFRYDKSPFGNPAITTYPPSALMHASLKFI